MKKSWWLVSAIILIARTVNADQVEETRCVKQIDEASRRLNVVFIKNHLAPLDLDITHATIKRSPDINRKVDVLQFHTTTKTSIYCLPSTGDILSLYRNDIDYNKGLQYDQPPAPNWTEEQAIASAKLYVEAVFGYFPKEVASPTAKFEPIRNLSKYYAGRWHIHWPRVDSEGRPFNTDALNVYLSENQGLTSTALNFFSNYQEPKGPLISQNEALKIGKPAAETLVNRWLESGFQLGEPKIILGIVNPNHILQAKTMEDTVALTTPEARLVWGLIYNLTSNGSPVPHQVQVWVDAQTKEVVGGDLH